MLNSDQFFYALDIVLEEVESAIESLNKEGSDAFQKGKYEEAKELIEKGSKMKSFHEKVLGLKEE